VEQWQTGYRPRVKICGFNKRPAVPAALLERESQQLKTLMGIRLETAHTTRLDKQRNQINRITRIANLFFLQHVSICIIFQDKAFLQGYIINRLMTE
jgi:hypothetical protein